MHIIRHLGLSFPLYEEDLENWDKRNNIAGDFLKCCVTEGVFQEIKYYKDVTEIWKILKTIYKKSDEFKKLVDQKDVEKLKEQVATLQNLNQRLINEVAKLRKENTSLKEDNEILQYKCEKITNNNVGLNNKVEE